MRRKLVCLFLAFLLMVCTGAGAESAVETLQEMYASAELKMTTGDYAGAAGIFDSLGSYSDSSQMAIYCKAISVAEDLGMYDVAIDAFIKLGNFKDCVRMAAYYTGRQCEAVADDTLKRIDTCSDDELMNAKSCLGDAIEQYNELMLFKDCMNRLSSCKEKLSQIDEAISGRNISSDISAQTESTSTSAVTLTCFLGSRGDEPFTDNKIYEKIRDEFGICFKFEYLTGDLDETISNMTYSQDYPDLIYAGYDADILINKGALINLLDYISPEKTPRLWAHIEPQKARLIEKVNGKDTLYIIPDYGLPDGPEIILNNGGPAFYIQKQVLVDAGYPDVKNITIEHYFELIANFMKKHPCQDDGTPYTGFAILCDSWYHFCLIDPVQHLMGRPNDGEVLIDVNDPGFHTETFIDKPYAKHYYKLLNEMYQKGIINKETFVMSQDDYIDLIAGGSVLGMFDHAWNLDKALTKLYSDGKYENTYVALGPVYTQDTEGIPEGWTIEEHYLNGTLPDIRRGFGISVKSQYPEKIVAMWEEMLSDEWQLLLNWGVEGEDYYIDNGRLLMTDKQYLNTNDARWRLSNKADGLFSPSPKKEGWIMNDIKVGDKIVKSGNCWEPGKQAEIVFSQMNDYDKDFLAHYHYTKWTDFFNPPIELAPYGEAWMIDYTPVDVEYSLFTTIQDKDLPEIIICDPDKFDAKWDAFVEEIKPYAKVFEDYMQERVLMEVYKVLDNK